MLLLFGLLIYLLIMYYQFDGRNKSKIVKLEYKIIIGKFNVASIIHVLKIIAFSCIWYNIIYISSFSIILQLIVFVMWLIQFLIHMFILIILHINKKEFITKNKIDMSSKYINILILYIHQFTNLQDLVILFCILTKKDVDYIHNYIQEVIK